MTADTAEAGLAQAIDLYNRGHRTEAEALCATLLARHGPHPALDQLMAVLCQERGEAAAARRHIARSLAARPGHVPSLMVAALAAQDERDLAAAEDALEQVLRLQPEHVAAAVNLGIVHLQQGRLEDAMARFGAAWKRRPETFGRIANALASEPTGALWLDAAALKAALSAAAS